MSATTSASGEASMDELATSAASGRRSDATLLRAMLYEMRFGRLDRLDCDPPRRLRVPRWYRKTTFPASPPSFTIVTPSLNHAHFLETTVESVLEQRHPRLEYVVQDGGSTDGTIELLERYSSDLARWDSSGDRGQADAINKGFVGTTGEIMAYLNSDDIVLPGAFAYVARYFAEHPEVDAVYGHRVLIDSEGREVGRQVLPQHDDAMLAWADYVPQETLYWRRRLWDRVGGNLDDSFQFAMDWDLLVRFVDAGATIVRLPRFLGAFRVSPAQKTQAWSEVGDQEMARIRARVHGREVEHVEISAHLVEYRYRHLAIQRRYRLGLLRI